MADARLSLRLKVLIAKKETLFQRLQQLYDKSKKIADKKVLKDFLIRYSTVTETCEQFKGLVEEINLIQLELDENYNVNCQEINAADELFCHIKSIADSINEEKLKHTNEPAVSSEIVSPKLPQISIPEFDGNPLKWSLFYATFKSLIHENGKLDNISKLHYLLGNLSGSALVLCSGIPPTAENYLVMWNSLIDKYEDQRQIAFMYLNQILKFKELTVESAQNLNLFIEKFDSAVSALKKVNVGNLSDFILMTVALQKLDTNTHRLFEQSLNREVIPTYEQLASFIKDQAKILGRTCNASGAGRASQSRAVMHSFTTSADQPENKESSDSQNQTCPNCQGDHRVYQCPKLLAVTPKERVQSVSGFNLCFNCLRSGHTANNCPSNSRCRKCSKRHHTILHFDRAFVTNGRSESSTQNNSGNSSHHASQYNQPKNTAVSLCSTSAAEVSTAKYTVLLATAQVKVVSSFGEKIILRFLIDSASQCNFITQKCCQRLKLPTKHASVIVSGIGVSGKSVKGQTHLTFSSKYNEQIRYSMDALIVDKITEQLPSCIIDGEVCKQFQNLRLADEEFYRPGEIDGMIGAELVPYILNAAKVTGPELPVAVDSSLGFIIMGQAKSQIVNTVVQSYCCVDQSQSVDQLLQQFWELEEIPTRLIMNPDDSECEKIFLSSVKRDTTGRYEVSLPFIEPSPELGDSYSTALRRFKNLEKKFVSSPTFQREYGEVLRDYIDQNHMTLALNSDLRSHGYFIPHHGILKISSSSTPLRVVFDASATTNKGVSLNQVLYTGPKLQTDIFKILLNFRLFPFAMTSDVRQMYRQIKLCPEHQKYQCLLWRFSCEDPIQIYKLTTVAFGVKSSPYLALRTLRQLATDEADRFPLASKVVLSDVYIDDIICSVPDAVSAHSLYRELIELFQAGGMELVKWATNLPELYHELPEKVRLNQILEFNTEFLKVLGLQWEANQDLLSFSISPEKSEYTKRSILRTVARIWDPIGILCPVSLHVKLLIQELWVLKLGWDEPIPTYLNRIWNKFQRELSELARLKIPRHIGFEKSNSLELLGFCDASSKAYSAVIYSRTVQSTGKVFVRILCAKSKVAPVKQLLTIPRLELCAMVLLARLLNCVMAQYESRAKIDHVFAFSDSMVALNWISDAPHRWKTFVANRVSKVRALVDVSCWYHVSSGDNPADSASRGLSPTEFLQNDLWLSGPPWCLFDRSEWPVKPFVKTNSHEMKCEAKVVAFPVVRDIEHPLYLLINRCGTWLKLLYSMVFVLRFAKLLPKGDAVKAHDLNEAENRLIRFVQRYHFAEEFRLLEKGELSSPKLRPLKPFLDKGVIRVGGRLSNAAISYEQQHPVLLPKRDQFVHLLIDFYHQFNLHAGPHLVTSLLRQRYWILAVRGVIRHRIKMCNICFKVKPRSPEPMMADLPNFRVSQAKAFLHTGVDYAGPFYITLSRHRGVRSQKAYICLFTCLVTRAVHLELASDLSTDKFLEAFKRFLARRGPCSVVYSDSGTNFIGARNYLNTLYEFVQSEPYKAAVNKELCDRRITWKFNPPAASHFGGAWEAMVKSVKIHLTRVIGEQILSYEEFSTVLTQIEALLNSRPLVWQSSDASEGLPLTPAHFLTLTPLQGLPAYDETETPINRLRRKELLDKLVQSYWKRWHQEYLSELQSRQKWNTPACPVVPGTIVLIKNENLPPLQWPTGVVQEVFPGQDGVIRVATVKTTNGTYKRPVVKLCPLPSQ